MLLFAPQNLVYGRGGEGEESARLAELIDRWTCVGGRGLIPVGILKHTSCLRETRFSSVDHVL